MDDAAPGLLLRLLLLLKSAERSGTHSPLPEQLFDSRPPRAAY